MTPKIDAKAFTRYAGDPAAFRGDLVVDVDGIAKRLGNVMDPWQRDDFAAMDPALMRCNGRKPDAVGPGRAYLERGRGHSKTTDLAVTCCWALAFSNRPLKGFAFAADKDQARLLRDAMQTLIRLNPWLGAILTVQADGVVNSAKGHPGEGGTLSIEASDVGSSYGILPDLIVADELVHWQGDGALWHSLISSAAKRANCLLVVISNAGFCEAWQWGVREAARTDEGWYFSRLDGPKASWLTPERLAEQRRMLPSIAYLRLWENQWSSGGGDALTESDIKAAFDDSLRPMKSKEAGWLFVAGVDLGLTRDCSAVVVLAIPDKRYDKVRLAYAKLWRPSLGKKVNLSDVEHYILWLDEMFGLENVAFDPWQAELLASRLEADAGHYRRNQQRRQWAKPWMREVTPTGANLREQATLVIEYFGDRRLELFPCDALYHDLLKLRVEEKSYGCRLVSPRDSTGHGDTFSAFAAALLIGHEVSGERPAIAGAVVDGLDDGLSPLERHLKRVREMEADINAERERLAKLSDSEFQSSQALIENFGTAAFRRLKG